MTPENKTSAAVDKLTKYAGTVLGAFYHGNPLFKPIEPETIIAIAAKFARMEQTLRFISFDKGASYEAQLLEHIRLAEEALAFDPLNDQ